MLRRFMDRLRGRSTDDQPAATPARRDYVQERATERHAGMSDEDRAWESASRQRDQDSRAAREGNQPPTPSG